MARLVGVDLPREKRVEVALTFVSLLKPITKLRVIFVVRSLATSVAKLKFKATKVHVTVKDYQSADNVHIPTLVLVRVHVLQLLVRRRRPSNGRRKD
jgi:ribosomal protein S13